MPRSQETARSPRRRGSVSTTPTDEVLIEPGSPARALEWARAWRRFWARLADLWIGAFLVSSVLSTLVPVLYVTVVSYPGGKHLLVLVMLPLVLVLDALSMAMFGATPGKAVAGIKVLGTNEQRLPFRTLIKRNMELWVWGLGVGIPIVNLVAMWNSKQRLAMGVLTTWDEGLQSRSFVDPGTEAGTWRAFAFFVVVGACLLGYNVYSSTPNAILAASLREVQAVSPQMIDDETRLDGAVAGSNGELIYRYTLVAVEPANEDLPSVRGLMQEQLSKELADSSCDDPIVKSLITSGVPIVHRYYDAKGRRIASVRLDRRICAQWRQDQEDVLDEPGAEDQKRGETEASGMPSHNAFEPPTLGDS